ncbi:DJ-1/PfpI family protein [Paenibacillus sp. B1-33]|uniref:DJ-1/PfpI family protein n=1 Tax=unclassified Paenibacillus TaxID=185978 RepID=UPI003D2B40DA
MNQQWNVGIVLFDDVEVLDFAGPFEVLSVTTYPDQDPDTTALKPFQVRTVSEHGNMITARNGLKVVPDFSFCNAPHFDIVIVPGGLGARKRELHNPHMIKWIQERMRTVDYMTSVCTGALLLAEAGLLNGKRATTHWASYDLLANKYPEVEVVRDVKFAADGSIVSSGGISAGIHMAFYLVQQLLGAEVARTTAKDMEYDIVFDSSSSAT